MFEGIDDVPDEFVVHVEDRDATPAISESIEEIGARVGLTSAELRQFSALGIDVLVKLQYAAEDALSRNADLRWTGYPMYGQVETLIEIICSARSARDFGCVSGRQLAMYISQLRVSMRNFFEWHSTTYRREPGQLDNVFRFLRSAESLGDNVEKSL